MPFASLDQHRIWFSRQPIRGLQPRCVSHQHDSCRALRWQRLDVPRRPLGLRDGLCRSSGQRSANSVIHLYMPCTPHLPPLDLSANEFCERTIGPNWSAQCFKWKPGCTVSETQDSRTDTLDTSVEQSHINITITSFASFRLFIHFLDPGTWLQTQSLDGLDVSTLTYPFVL